MHQISYHEAASWYEHEMLENIYFAHHTFSLSFLS
jgi:hypothetical protein